MDDLLQRSERFVNPLYQDLDGVSRLDEIRRIARIARRLYCPADSASCRVFELLLLFQGLGNWLERVGNISRAALAIGSGLSEPDLRQVTQSIRRLDSPVTPAEQAVASARMIDRAGLLGLASRFAAARREGLTIEQIAGDAAAPADPAWLSDAGRRWLERRRQRRREFCRFLDAELAGEDAEHPET